MSHCERCHAFEDDGSLHKQIMSYLDAMDPSSFCEEEVYRQRLMACDGCEKMGRGLCGYCGCFVLIRARKQAMDCPSPGGSRWAVG